MKTANPSTIWKKVAKKALKWWKKVANNYFNELLINKFLKS